MEPSSADALRAQIEALQAQLASLERIGTAKADFEAWTKERGFATPEAFLRATGFLPATESAASTARPAPTVAAAAAEAASREAGSRRRMTPPERTAIEAALRAGGESTSAIAARFGFSLATVMKVKKEIGLVQERPRGGGGAEAAGEPAATPAAEPGF